MNRSIYILIVVLLQGCFQELDPDLAKQFPDYPNHDFDGDGLLDAEDCDDSDPNIRRKEYFYRDADGDGFGLENDSKFVCVQELPEGYVPAKIINGVSLFDCNDEEYYANPLQHEVCDRIDNDCNGFVDDHDGLDAPVWYQDADGDGYGNPLAKRNHCADENGAGPAGYVSNDIDCDDLHDESHPGGIEVCDAAGRDENCNGIANEDFATDAPFWYRDADGDGYGNALIDYRSCTQPEGFVGNSFDCNDTKIEANPDQVERCDEIDNDCDGIIDEPQATDVTTYYRDSDGDGYGTPYLSISLCPIYKPQNYILDDSDCNDDNPNQYPNAPEFCNTIDDDCDGNIDEGVNNDAPVNSPIWYIDSDNDGFGTNTDTVTQCTKPAGYVDNAQDCDDLSASISPLADELCTETIDENCDGDPVYRVPPHLLNSWYPDSDGDGYGNPNFVIRMCLQPLNYVDNPDDCNDTDFWVHPEDDLLHVDASGQPIDHRELCNGKIDLCENDLDGSLTPLDDERDDDGDGFVECTLDVAPLLWEDPNSHISGGEDCDDTRSYRYPNAPERCNGLFDRCEDLNLHGGFPSDEVDDDGDLFVECEGFDPIIWEGDSSVIGGDDCNDNSPNTYVGAAPGSNPLACLTDLDGDGFSDRSWTICPTEMTSEDARYAVYGNVNNFKIYSQSGGDIDGDGIPDLLYSGSDNWSNYSYIIPGSYFSNTTPSYFHSNWAYRITISRNGSHFFVDDFTGDGRSDFITGDPYSSYFHSYRSGVLWLFESENLNTSLALSSPATISGYNYDIYWEGDNGGDYLGYGRNITDIDGDGLGDFAFVGLYAKHNFVSVGKVYLFRGSSVPSLSATEWGSSADITLVSVTGVVSADIDGDGLQDIIVSNESGSCYFCGISYVYLATTLASSGPEIMTSPVTADYTIYGDIAYGSTRIANSAGDVDGDGKDDLLFAGTSGLNGRTIYYLYLSSTLLSGGAEFYTSDADYIFDGGIPCTDSAGTYRRDCGGISAGDVDGDGKDDLLLEWQENDVDRIHYISLFLGDSLGSTQEIDFSDADFIFNDFHSAAAFGDIDGDGQDEFILSNPYGNDYANNGGVSAIFSACEN